MSFELESDAFEAGGEIPARYTCDGENVSPPLRWSGVPEGTESLALVMDDPDAPAGTWVHWVMYRMYADRRELSEGVPPDEEFGSARQGVNDFGNLGYGGPCPPENGAHRYSFRLYALDGEPGLAPGASKEELMDAIEGHVLGQAERVGTYRRR